MEREGGTTRGLLFLLTLQQRVQEHGKLSLPGLLIFLPYNGCNIFSELSRITNLYNSRSCKHLKRKTFMHTLALHKDLAFVPSL